MSRPEESPEVAEAVLDRVVDLLAQRIGLRGDITLRGRLRRAVTDAAATSGGSLPAYADALTGGGEALQDLVNRVTVQETAFFRHPRHFEVLAHDVLPTLTPPVRIWSAGCANGQEAFSLAMVLAEQGIDGHVVATDLSTAALGRTRAGRYTDREISGLSPLRLGAHLRSVDGDWEVRSALRDRVSVVAHNLLDPLPAEVASCQVVFCRNVLIYLSPAPIRRFLDRLADTLPAPLVLFLGGAETLWQVTDRFKAVPTRDTFLYRQVVPAAETAREPRPRAAPPPVGAPERVDRTRTVAAGRPAPGARSAAIADQLAHAGQTAAAAGDFRSAVEAFRRCTGLRPYDPLAQLHLGLALEGVGDLRSAGRAFAAARAALLVRDQEVDPVGVEGYAPAELLKLLDTKQGGTRSW